MYKRNHVDTNTNHDTRTYPVTGRWYVSAGA
jgi:hypothetical protein